MSRYEISNRTSGYSLGIYEGEDETAALDAMAREAGYDDYVASIKDMIETVAFNHPDWDEEQIAFHTYWQQRSDLVITEAL